MTTDARLPLFRRRGGPRPGAGRKAGPNPRVRHVSRGALSGREPCHVTLKVLPGLRTLRDVRVVRALEETFRALLQRADFRVFRRTGPVLGDRYHLRVLRTPLEVRRALAYCLLNARKHLGARAPRVGRIDPASSGAWFTGWRAGVVAVARSPAPVARAVSWLLRVGWRRHGLLDPGEVPGMQW